MEPETDLLQRRFEQSYLHLAQKELEDAPSVQAVTYLLVVGNPRLISPASCSYLVTKLPRLQRVQLKLFDNEKRDSELRKRNREGTPNSSVVY
jgi:hypothetical protein